MPDHSTDHLPMGQTLGDIPKIKVIFRGFIISKIKHNVQAMIGALNPAFTPPFPMPLAIGQSFTFIKLTALA